MSFQTYHRRGNLRTQTIQDAMRQQATSEVCGRPDNSGGSLSSFASVKAYRGDFGESRKNGFVLDSGSIEFETDIPPYQGHASVVKWPENHRGVRVVQQGVLCCITANILKIIP